MKNGEIKALFISVICDLLLCSVLFVNLACAGSYPLKAKGTVNLVYYNEPRDESLAFRCTDDIAAEWKRMALDEKQSIELRNYVNSIKNWIDDSLCDRKLLTFAGQFEVSNNGGSLYFTEEGIVYYRNERGGRYFGTLSDKGREFLLSFRPEAQTDR